MTDTTMQDALRPVRRRTPGTAEAPTARASMDDVGAHIEAQIPRLRRYARALVRDPARAEDLVQDCLERAWSRQHLFRAGTDMRAWLFTILHNLHANAARKHSRRPGFVPLDEAPPLSHPPGQIHGVELSALQDALQQLPQEQRQVLLLVGMEQMRYREVAEVLDIPVGTVMSRLSRGRERLRVLLGQAGEERTRGE